MQAMEGWEREDAPDACRESRAGYLQASPPRYLPSSRAQEVVCDLILAPAQSECHGPISG